MSTNGTESPRHEPGSPPDTFTRRFVIGFAIVEAVLLAGALCWGGLGRSVASSPPPLENHTHAY